MKTNGNKQQRYVVFFGTEMDYAYGGRVYIGSGVIGSINRIKKLAQRGTRDKLHLIAYGTTKTDGQFREFLRDVKQAKIKGNWHRVEWNIMRTMELLRGDVVLAAA